MTKTRAFIATEKGSGYLQQLCKHFAHKLEVSFDPMAGRIAFAEGECRLAARADGLELTVEAADPATTERLAEVIARHLVRFAFREDMTIAWQPLA